MKHKTDPQQNLIASLKNRLGAVLSMDNVPWEHRGSLIREGVADKSRETLREDILSWAMKDGWQLEMNGLRGFGVRRSIFLCSDLKD